MKRLICLISGLLMASLMLIACGDNTNTAAPSTMGAVETTTKPFTSTATISSNSLLVTAEATNTATVRAAVPTATTTEVAIATTTKPSTATPTATKAPTATATKQPTATAVPVRNTPTPIPTTKKPDSSYTSVPNSSYQLGQTVTNGDYRFNISKAAKSNQFVPGYKASSGNIFGTFYLSVGNSGAKGGAVNVTIGAVSVFDENGRQLFITSIGGPSPSFPDQDILDTAGDERGGWVTFQTSTTARSYTIKYQLIEYIWDKDEHRAKNLPKNIFLLNVTLPASSFKAT